MTKAIIAVKPPRMPRERRIYRLRPAWPEVIRIRDASEGRLFSKPCIQMFVVFMIDWHARIAPTTETPTKRGAIKTNRFPDVHCSKVAARMYRALCQFLIKARRRIFIRTIGTGILGRATPMARIEVSALTHSTVVIDNMWNLRQAQVNN